MTGVVSYDCNEEEQTDEIKKGKNMSMNLSKSRYTAGVLCPKALWLKEHKPEAFDESSLHQAVLDTGNEVGNWAMGLFGAYTEVPFEQPLSRMITKTEELLQAGTPVLCEASFSHKGLFCSVDILRNLGGKAVEVYEVKSSTELKDINVHDVAFQVYVLSELGYEVRKACLVHLNRDYVRHGALDVTQLFKIKDLTATVRGMLDETGKKIAELQQTLAQPEEPEREICQSCNKPYSCGFWKYCTRMLPENNVFCINGRYMKEPTKFKYYAKGLISFDDLLRSPDFKKLSDRVRIQLEEKPVINRSAISSFLDTLSFPLYFLDFETFQSAIPLYDGDSPYSEQIPFQYSLHYMENEDAEIRHREFLAVPGKDPRRETAERLCKDIPENVCVLAYNMQFEKTVIKNLAGRYPDLAEHLMHVHDNIRDLMTPFEKKDYYLPAMQGSYSIKHVLPSLYPDDPGLDYSNLEGVHKGDEASAAFLSMGRLSPEEQQALRGQLLKYCGLDTWAMVKVWMKLKESVQKV